MREYWLVDPQQEIVGVLARQEDGLALHGTYRRGDALASPALTGLGVDIDAIFA